MGSVCLAEIGWFMERILRVSYRQFFCIFVNPRFIKKVKQEALLREFKILWALFQGDWKRSTRDFSLLWMLSSPVVNAFGLYLLLPRLTWFFENDLDLKPYIPLIVGFVFLWITPLSIGLWSTMLFLEEKESGIQAYAILPINQVGFLSYRLWLPGLYSFFVILLGLLVAQPFLLPFGHISWISFAAALQTPFFIQLLFRFSNSRMQAIHNGKLLKILGIPMFLAFMWPPGFQNLAGLLFPPYWLLKTYLIGVNQDPGFTLHLGFTLCIFILLLIWAKRVFLTAYFNSTC